jgi:hypothetical protein
MPEQIGTVLKVINRQLASLTMIVFQLFSKMNLVDVWQSLQTHKFKSCLTMPMPRGTSSKYGGPSDHFSGWHLVEHSPCILHAATFCIHVNQAIPHKDSGLTPTLNDLLMNTPALFKCNYAGTSIQHPHKSSRVWLHRLLLHWLK